MKLASAAKSATPEGKASTGLYSKGEREGEQEGEGHYLIVLDCGINCSTS